MQNPLVHWSLEVSARLPELSICIGIINNVHVEKENEQIQKLKKAVYEEVRAKYNIEKLKDNPTVRAYRDFYWKLDIDPTKTRPSGEALLGRVLHGHDLPSISMVVDAYNLASMKTIIQMSGFDKDRLNSPLQIRFAENDETFTGIGISSGWFWQNTVSNNNISCKKYGVYIEVADSNVISENIVMNSKEEGIHIYNLDNNLVSHYIVSCCYEGISIYGGGDNNTILYNKLVLVCRYTYSG